MGKFKDLTGLRFGGWAVSSEHKSTGNGLSWLCVCDCGTRKWIPTSALTSNRSKSCGCSRKTFSGEDLTGKRFGRLLVMSYTESDTGGNSIWRCQCDCGNIVEVYRNNLIRELTKSCGCLAKEVTSRNRKRNLVGQRYGKLLVVKSLTKRSGTSVVWQCLCDCGNVADVSSNNLQSGQTKSCGCLLGEVLAKRNTTHGLSKTKEYDRIVRRKRKERKKLLDGDWCIEKELELRKFFPACVVCGMTEEEHIKRYNQPLCVDHVYLLSKGFGLCPGNAVLLCIHHNSIKSNKLPEDLPDETRIPILKAAQDFKNYWESYIP